MKRIKKSIAISAPKEKVWQVLTDDKLTRIWYAEFSPGTYAETDWKVGSKALFTDADGNGMITKVIENKPAEKLSVEYTGMIVNGKEDYESDGAKAMMGGFESYRLSEKEGVTHLAIEGDMSADYFDMMSLSWDKALQKIKELGERG